MTKKIIKYHADAKNPGKDLPSRPNVINFNRKGNVLEGNLAVVSIENVMQLMCHAGLSGELRIVAPRNAACFIIDKGILIFCYIKFNFLRVGERLLLKKCISKENLKECLRVYREQANKHRFGSLLVEKGFVSKNDLEETIREQVKDIFFEVLSWNKGSFSFSPCKNNLNEDILLEERIDHLIIEGILQLERKAEEI